MNVITLKNKTLTVFELKKLLQKEFGDKCEPYSIDLDEGIETLNLTPGIFHDIDIKIKDGQLYYDVSINFIGVLLSFIMAIFAIIPGLLMFAFLIWRTQKLPKVKLVNEYILNLDERNMSEEE